MNEELSTAARLERGFTASTPCGQVSNGIACDTQRKGVEKLCPDCNPWRPADVDEITRLKGEAGVLKALLTLSRRSLVEIVADDSHEQEMLDALIDKIDAAMTQAPVVQFVPADDTEGGAA